MKLLILAGGVGSRLWPLSTKKTPKQFQAFLSKKTLLQESYERLKFAKQQDIFISTNQEYVELVKQQLPNVKDENIIAEPLCKDTAPSIAFGVKYLEKLFGPNETVSIIYADHNIKNTKEFESKIKFGHEIAKKNDKIIIIEVKAKTPNPNLGYVKIGKLIQSTDNIEVYSLDKFIEKPDVKTAEKFVESYKYLWNTGYYIFRIDTFLNAIKKYSPEIQEILPEINDFKNCKQLYSKFPKISLDYALMEKINTNNIWIIPAQLGWSDIGTWQTLFEEKAHSTNENLIEGKINAVDTKGSIIINKEKNKQITVINLENFVVINSEDEILICPKNTGDKIKNLKN